MRRRSVARAARRATQEEAFEFAEMAALALWPDLKLDAFFFRLLKRRSRLTLIVLKDIKLSHRLAVAAYEYFSTFIPRPIRTPAADKSIEIGGGQRTLNLQRRFESAPMTT